MNTSNPEIQQAAHEAAEGREESKAAMEESGADQSQVQQSPGSFSRSRVSLTKVMSGFNTGMITPLAGQQQGEEEKPTLSTESMEAQDEEGELHRKGRKTMSEQDFGPPSIGKGSTRRGSVPIQSA